MDDRSSAASRPIALIAPKELGIYWSLEGSGSRQGSNRENSWLARTTSESKGSVHHHHSSPALSLSNKACTLTGRHAVYRRPRSNQRRSSTASNQLTVLHPARDPDSLVTTQCRNSGLPSPPSKAGAFSSSLRTYFSVAILPATHADSPRDGRVLPSAQGTVERCLQPKGRSSAAFSTRSDNAISLPFLGTDNAISLPFLGTDNAISLPFLGTKQKWSPLFWKGEVLDTPGTYRLVQCAQKIGRSWALILEGEYFGIQACSPSGLSCSANPFNRTEYILYNNGVENHQRYGWATDRGILFGSSGPWLSAPGLQRVGLPKSSSGFCWRPIQQHRYRQVQHDQLVDHKSRQARLTSLAREQR